LIIYQRPSNYNHYKLYKILMILNEISNDNEITCNLNHQFISRKIYS
jgi:hypothetical protein